MVVIGHSGTKHFFPQSQNPPKTYIGPFIETCNIEFAQWVELDVDSQELKLTVWNSGKGTKADEFTIVKGKSSKNDPKYHSHKEKKIISQNKANSSGIFLKIGGILMIVLVLVGICAMVNKREKKVRACDSEYYRSSDQEQSNEIMLEEQNNIGFVLDKESD